MRDAESVLEPCPAVHSLVNLSLGIIWRLWKILDSLLHNRARSLMSETVFNTKGNYKITIAFSDVHFIKFYKNTDPGCDHRSDKELVSSAEMIPCANIVCHPCVTYGPRFDGEYTAVVGNCGINSKRLMHYSTVWVSSQCFSIWRRRWKIQDVFLKIHLSRKNRVVGKQK